MLHSPSWLLAPVSQISLRAIFFLHSIQEELYLKLEKQLYIKWIEVTTRYYHICNPQHY